MNDPLRGRVAVVTGGASGIGQACSRLLTERGAIVVIADVDGAAAAKAAGEIGCRHVVLDVCDAPMIGAAVAEIESDVGPVAILVNSAGIVQAPLAPENLPLQLIDKVMQVNQRGLYLCSAAFGMRMVSRRRGAIVNIASIAGMRSMPLHVYAPVKAAVIAITECLAAEWGPSGVRVNTVSPGYTLTPAIKSAIERGQRDPALMRQSAALGRMIEPVEIARAVAFLVSDDAAAITGVNLPVDGGWLVATSWTTYGGLRRPQEAVSE
jgi:NAD(P)-dependent dehydrogenase (short-subunit alcohol dehydrogenase family)